MSELRPRTLQIIWLLVAAMLLTGAAMVHGPMDQLGRQYELAGFPRSQRRRYQRSYRHSSGLE